MRKNKFLLLCCVVGMSFPFLLQAANRPVTQKSYLMNLAVDMSTDFEDFTNIYFLADELSSFDIKEATGTIRWKRHRLASRQAFNTNGIVALPLKMLDFPSPAYDNEPDLKFTIDFITPRTIRVRMLTTPVEQPEEESLMLVKQPGERYFLERGGEKRSNNLYKSVWKYQY